MIRGGETLLSSTLLGDGTVSNKTVTGGEYEGFDSTESIFLFSRSVHEKTNNIVARQSGTTCRLLLFDDFFIQKNLKGQSNCECCPFSLFCFHFQLPSMRFHNI